MYKRGKGKRSKGRDEERRERKTVIKALWGCSEIKKKAEII